mgnify:FL=1
MADSAANLVDNVIPVVPIRQWVLSFPFNLRYLFSYHKKALSQALAITTRCIGRHYLNQAKELGLKNAEMGAVTLIQRFDLHSAPKICVTPDAIT